MSDTIYYYKPSGFQRRRPSPFTKLARMLFYGGVFSITALTVVLLLVNIFQHTQEGNIISPLPDKPHQNVLSAFVETVKEALPNNRALGEKVTSSLEGTKGTYAVAIKNLKTGEEYYQNEHMQFDSASLYKLWVMGTVYKQVQDGTLTMDQPLHADIKRLNEIFDIDPEFAELTEGEIDFTVKSALEQMITISHNYAALTLSNTVKNSNMKNFITEYGLTESKTGSPPQTSAYDILKFYEQLYNGKVVSPEASTEMLETLKRQKLNDRIPKYLPPDTVVAHKTGELGGVKHDAGIVYSPKGDYIFVVLSKSGSPAGAAERIALLSKDIYEYFNK